MLVPLLLNLDSAVVVAPTITAQPQSVTVTAGTPVTFSVMVSGSLPMTIQWYKNGAPIPGATGLSYTTAPTVYPGDNGALFYVIISNVAGSAQSITVSITVAAPAPTPSPIVPLTSGTVGLTPYRTRNIIDMAFRRAGKEPQTVTSEQLYTAIDNLYLILSSMANRGVLLSCVEVDLLPLYQGQFAVPCPIGTVDILNLNIRTLQALSGTASASEGVAANVFDRNLTTSCIQTTAGGFIELTLASPTQVTNLGLLPQADGVWNIVIETSTDNVAWNQVYSNSNFNAQAGQWQWLDLESPLTTTAAQAQAQALSVRLRAVGSTVLAVTEFVVANTPQEVPMSPINKDDYAALTNPNFQGRPVEYWYNRQLNPPQLMIWPAADLASTFRQLVLFRHRQIQDVGTLTQIIEVPQRWYNAIIWDLAFNLCLSVKDIDPARFNAIQPLGSPVITAAWNAESDGGPTYITPNISPYTM